MYIYVAELTSLINYYPIFDFHSLNYLQLELHDRVALIRANPLFALELLISVRRVDNVVAALNSERGKSVVGAKLAGP